MLAPSEKSFVAGAAGPTPDVARERCDFIYRRALPGAGAALALTVLLSAYLVRVQPVELVLLWLALAIGCAAYFAALAFVYRRLREAAEPQLWIRRAAFAATMLGASWGFAAAVFFPGAQDEQVLIAFVVALVTAGGLPLFSTVWWLYALYAAAVILPFNVVLFAHGTAFFRVFGAVVPLFYVAAVAAAHELSSVFASAYGVRSAYRQLADENAGVQAQLAEQLGRRCGR